MYNANAYGIVKNGHSFEVILDDEKSAVQTIIMDDKPEYAAVIQQTPCGAFLVSFVNAEFGHRVHAPMHARDIDVAVTAAVDTLLYMEV